ncbi:MAG: 4Fe-4S dicluster domain-containing protein [Candidatus Thermoplasmatota archaeon]|nr:(4Fe-4S)-binding protein [Euryarchaeota archaeon]MBU4032684.1 4Fe-4S dicluster domain-containing protein [Candidatus Thermoplasmatota archaeon]MBU4071426.1 4Fe-4S dicluster domain-containing protein [Candidatus Thermoplasmatota archaeon]MBU4143664.1 4Fe-4S dicluster domain-containing protein [Candidatus Thermoplasmatota archaeon]MBU4591484.1 4Fe-4S dicluster domain-containing protein [Candidatus Thermoplasmatota archaeon]
MAKMIKKDKVRELLDKLANEKFDIFAPIGEDGITLYRKLGAETPLLNFQNSSKPPKEIFFPQTEKMFDITVENHRLVGATEPPMASNPILLFGARPCDMRAMKVLDALFTWDYTDPYYVNKRERSTVISFACTLPDMPRESCFCTSVGGATDSREGADMLWTDIGSEFVVESLTDKGGKILELGGNLFTEATPDMQAKAKQVSQEATEAISRKLDTEGVKEALEATFDNAYWDEFSARCLGCGICTLLCPTCHCFDINDLVVEGKASRERTWDSCQFTYYTIHASNHNPRPVKKHRQRNRIYHKFLYSEKNLGLLGCVGCGRCIYGCPVNIDIIEVVEGAKEVLK